jgi:hypothetical protein
MQAIITFGPVWSNRRLAYLADCDEATASRIASLLAQCGAVIKSKMKTAKGMMCIFSAAAECPAPIRRRSSKPRQSAGDCTDTNKGRGTSSTSPLTCSPSSSDSRPPRARATPQGQQAEKQTGTDTKIPGGSPASTDTTPASPAPATAPLPPNVVVLPKPSPEARQHIRERQSSWHIRFLLARRPADELARYTVLVSAWLFDLEDDNGPGKAEFERVDRLARLADFEGHKRREFRRQHPELAGKAWKVMRPVARGSARAAP